MPHHGRLPLPPLRRLPRPPPPASVLGDADSVGGPAAFPLPPPAEGGAAKGPKPTKAGKSRLAAGAAGRAAKQLGEEEERRRQSHTAGVYAGKTPWEPRHHILGGRSGDARTIVPGGAAEAHELQSLLAAVSDVRTRALLFRKALKRCVAFAPPTGAPRDAEAAAQLALFEPFEAEAVRAAAAREKDWGAHEVFLERRAACPLGHRERYADDTDVVLAATRWWRDVCRSFDSHTAKALEARRAYLDVALRVLIAKQPAIPALRFLVATLPNVPAPVPKGGDAPQEPSPEPVG